MGIDTDFSSAYAKAAIAAGLQLPTSGNVFITMIDKFKDQIIPVARQLKVSLWQISGLLHFYPLTIQSIVEMLPQILHKL